MIRLLKQAKVIRVNIMSSHERIKNLIAHYVLKYNYWGYLFSRIRRKPVPGLPSIMGVAPETDGTISLLYNPDLVNRTEDKHILTVLEHEGMHLLNKHVSRLIRVVVNETNKLREFAKINIWNIAADCSVNVQANIRNPIVVAGDPWPPCLPKNYKLEENKVTEYYYYELLKGSGVDKLPDNLAFSNHDSWMKNLQGVPDLSTLSRKLEQHVQNIIKESVKSFNTDRGTLPAHVQELIKMALAPPKAPYYQIIRKLIRASRLSRFKRSPTKVNRKRGYVFLLEGDDCVPQISPFPGKTRDRTFFIVVLIDTSGSMSVDDILEGLSGVKNIIEKDRHCYTVVLEVDAGVEKEYEVKRVRDIQFNIKGRGGTTLGPGLLRAKELGCDVCLAFTDGYTENINAIHRKLMPKKLIWVINKGGTAKSVNQTGWIVNL
jgi:predicted metal-dependent peptidase